MPPKKPITADAPDTSPALTAVTPPVPGETRPFLNSILLEDGTRVACDPIAQWHDQIVAGVGGLAIYSYVADDPVTNEWIYRKKSDNPATVADAFSTSPALMAVTPPAPGETRPFLNSILLEDGTRVACDPTAQWHDRLVAAVGGAPSYHHVADADGPPATAEWIYRAV